MDLLELPSGLTLDYSNCLNSHAILRDDIGRFQASIQHVMTLTEHMRKTGVVPGHLSKDGEPELVLFPKLPYITQDGINTPKVMRDLDALSVYGREHIDAVVSFGIGGSYLGSKVIFDVHCGAFWNDMTDEERHNFPKFYFAGFNADSLHLQGVLHCLVRDAKVKGTDYKVMLVVISKSGSTIEPMANFIILEEELKKRNIAYEVVAITDTTEASEPTILRSMAEENDWKTFSVPNGVGGRFSVFTEVGLVVGALIGFDIRKFLAGAQAMDEACKNPTIFENPALLSATLKYVGAEQYGRIIEVFMPYGGSLHTLSDWYVQLLSESLGKGRDGRAPYGRTPVAAVGTMDMHAQVQEHQEGRLNKIVQFIKVKHWDSNLIVPSTYSQYDSIENFSNIGLNEILNVALDANRDALSSDNRFNLTVEIPELNAFHLGEIMFMYCWAIFFESILAGVDAFDQPGVEVYKRLLGPKLKDVKEESL